MAGKLFVLSAPSGAGKTTLVAHIIKTIGARCNLERVITYTSRSPRPGEIDGKDYYFLSHKEFECYIEQDRFIEYSQAYGNYYGSPKSIFQKIEEGSSFICVLDMPGALKLIKDYGATAIWIAIPSLKVLEERLRLRGTHEAEVLKRLEIASKELERVEDLSFFTHTILNDNLAIAIRDLENLICNELNVSLFYEHQSLPEMA